MTISKILLVESDQSVAHTLQRIVLGLGHSAILVADPLQALSKARACGADLVVFGAADTGQALQIAESLHRELNLPLLLIAACIDPALIARYKAVAPEGVLHWPANDLSIQLTLELALQRLHKEKQRAAAMHELAESEAQFRGIFTSAVEGVVVSDQAGNILLANPRAEALLGYALDELCGQSIELLLPERLRGPHRQHRAEFAPSPLPRPMGRGLNLIARRKDGSELPVDISLSTLPTSRGTVVISVIQDISARVAAEEELQRLNRMLRVLSAGNQALIRAGSENALLDGVCRAIVEVGGYPLAWVAFGADIANGAVQIAARVGEQDALESCRDHLAADYCLLTRVQSSGQPLILRASESGGWCEPACLHGFLAEVGLPLKHDGQTIGVLGIFARQESAFNQAELGLLSELADNLSYGIAGQRGDVARAQAESRLRLFAQAIASSANGIMLSDSALPDKPIIYVNPAFERITGYAAADILGRNARFLLGGDLAQAALEELRAALRQGREARVVLRIYRPNGSCFWNELSVAPVHDANDAVSHFVGIINDISERMRYEEQLERQATHDTLTGLANRALLFDRLSQAMLHAKRGERYVAVLLLDLDRFKDINDSFGHLAGDQILLAVAARIQSCVRDSDTVARLGGDEFVVVFENMAHEDVAAAARMIQDKLAESLTVPGAAEVFMNASIGIALFPGDGESAEILLKNADAAMYRAKEHSGASACFYAPEMEASANRRLSLEAMLRRALERNELALHYQPQLDLVSGRITGAEALLRWQLGNGEMISPVEFIPVAEKSGLILPIGRWVIATAARQQRQWLEQGVPAVPVAVNVSARQFREADLLSGIIAELAALGLEHRWLELEITESLMLDNLGRVLEILRALKGGGLNVSLDDFGTGYSSLSYLRRLPIGTIKIDRAFVMDVTTNPEDAAIVQAIISMAHSLGMKVIAEGVESEAQLNFLRRHRCDSMQGYFFSQAVPAPQFATMLREGRALPYAAQASGLRTLLLVDDEANVLAALRRILRHDGYRILTAGSGAEALDVLARETVQVVISDQRMPYMSGTELFERVRKIHPETVRIILSGHTALDSVIQAVNVGAVFRFLCKPWEEDNLRESIREAFLFHEARRKD